jgi:hypothetical protein
MLDEAQSMGGGGLGLDVDTEGFHMHRQSVVNFYYRCIEAGNVQSISLWGNTAQHQFPLVAHDSTEDPPLWGAGMLGACYNVDNVRSSPKLFRILRETCDIE